MAKLGHPLGELNLTRAAGACGIVQGVSIIFRQSPEWFSWPHIRGISWQISSNASCSLEEMVANRLEGQPLIFQVSLTPLSWTSRNGSADVEGFDGKLYLNKDRQASARLLQKVEALGCQAIMFTVDAAAASKRTLDQRTKVSDSTDDDPSGAPLGVSQAISGYQDDNLVWEDIKFIRRHTKLPLLIKGESLTLCIPSQMLKRRPQVYNA
jgi:L-lactate dehydrogenase (cytochrome)